MRFGLYAGPRLSCLIDGDYPELVPLSFAESRDPRFEFIDRGAGVVVIGDERVEPTAEAILLLDDVVRDGSSAVVRRLAPSERHRLVIEVTDGRLLRLGRRFCKKKNPISPQRKEIPEKNVCGLCGMHATRLF